MSAGTDIGTNFAGGCAVEIVKAAGRQARYCYEFNEIVSDLNDEHENLKTIRDGMQRQFDKDKANTKEPSGNLQLRLKEANKLIDKVEDLRRRAEAKKSCCPNGVYPNWICQYFVGKKAEERTKAMKQLNDELRQKLLPAHRYSLRYMLPSEDFILFKCTEEARNEILKAVKDEKKIRIGLHGMGGCGKTSLLMEILKELQDSEVYKTAFAVVSNPPVYRDIQGSIASWIGLKFEMEENVHVRAARLSMSFQKDKKYVIFLDDVWEMLDFNSIGIPVGKNCKVLLSTRQRHIFDLMKFDAVIYMSLLTKEEAWKLFQKHAGEVKEPFQLVAREITDECHKLPVAIKAVASSLRNKEDYTWTEVLATLKDRRRPLKIEKGLEDLYRCLKFSFDELKDAEERSLYLLCALFPSDSEIDIEFLIRFAFGLGIFLDVNSYQRARSIVRMAIDKFKNYCLLLQEGRYVKLHDMFHALASWEANNKTQVLMEPKQIFALTKTDYMKDMTRLYCQGIEEFPDQLNCPKLEILIVSNNGGCSSKFPDMFFKEMIKLKVLAIQNTSIGTKSDLVLPQPIKGLKKLRTLCLRGWTLKNISMIEKIEMLETIELSDCVIEELPKELANLKALKLFEVFNCKLGGDPYKVLATYSHLEELYFVDNYCTEVMQQLTGQNIARFFQQISAFKALQRYHLGIGGSIINTSKDYSSSKLISIKNFDAFSITNEAFQALSQKLEVLFFEKIKGDCKSIVPDMFPIQGECLKELKEFVLRDSDCINCLIDITNDQLCQTVILFASLQKLKVEAMPHLEALCHGPPPSGLFEKLKELFITNCSQLASLFTATAAQTMVMLEVVEVIDCGQLRHMIKVEDNDEDILVGSMLPNLKKISVKRCNSLKCTLPIFVANGLSQLETIEIEDAAELQYVFGDDDHKKNQDQEEINIDLSTVKILKLINLPIIISICPQNYDMKKLPFDKTIVKGCPGLEPEVKQQDGDEAMEQAELLSMSSGEDLRFNTTVRTTKDLVKATARQACCFFQFNTFVTNLSMEKDLLRSKLEGLPVPTEPSEDPQQQMLLEEATDLLEKVEMLEQRAEASKSCCIGVFPDWLGRYIVRKRLERMTKEVKLFNEKLAMIPHPASFQPSVTGNNFFLFESTKCTYNEILLALKDDETYMIGLYGLEGAGKTSLILEVCDEVNRLELFDMVAFVVVSPDIRRIQGDIAECLGLKFNYTYTEPENAAILSRTLNNGDKFLIILDDVWDVLKLQDVGIPLGKNCKVVLTTRLQHICTLMECRMIAYLSLLSEDESWILFQNNAGVIQDTLKDLALQLSKACYGLPLSINVMARALKDKPEHVWMEALKKLKSASNTSMSSLKSYDVLKLRIDNLGDEMRSLFFLCALFPRNSNIALEDLIRYAIGLGIFNDVNSYEKARIKVDATIDELIDSCLLVRVYRKRQYFCIHDLVPHFSELVKKIQLIVRSAWPLEEDMIDVTRLYCHDLLECPYQLNYPKIEFLFVAFDDKCLSDISATFFIEMIELKVLSLMYTSMGATPNLVLPQSMDGLKKLRTVCLRGWTIKNMSVLGKLEMLDTIELLLCVIEELPEELAELKRLSLLEVSQCKIYSNPFQVLTRCSQLEELYFVENRLPKMVSNDHHVVQLLHQIGSSKVLNRYHLEIGSSKHHLKNDYITKFFSINGFNIPPSNEEMKNMAQKLEVLFLENAQGNCKNIFPDMIPIERKCMNELTELLLHDSDNIECLFDATNYPLHHTRTVFSRLIKLRIIIMKNFKSLCQGLPPLNLFEKLEELFISGCSQLRCIVSVGKLNFCNLNCLQLEGCPNLTSIFTYSTAQTMVVLEILKLRDCISLKQIVKDEEEDDITPVGPIFTKLKQIHVEGCPHLEFIIPASFLGGISQLKRLEIEDAGMLKHVFGKCEREEGQNQSESIRKIDLPVLKIFKFVDLPNITNIFPQNYHIAWPNVAKLYVERCPLLNIPSELDSEVIQIQQGGGKSREQELELEAIQSSDMVVQSKEESKKVDEVDVGNPSVDLLTPTMASSSSEVAAIQQDKQVPSHTSGLAHPNDDGGFSSVSSNIQDDDTDRESKRDNIDIPSGPIATGSNFHSLNQDAAEVCPHSQEVEIVDAQGSLQKQKFCTVDSMNLQEGSIKIGKGSLHKDTEIEGTEVGTSTLKSMDKQPKVELDANGAKVHDTTMVHPRPKEYDEIVDTQEGLQEQKFCSVGSLNSSESINAQDNLAITKVSIPKDPAPEEPTVETSSQGLIDKQAQVATNTQHFLQDYEVSLPLPGRSALLSPSRTSIATISPTSEAPVSSSKQQHQMVEQLAYFQGQSSCFYLPDGASVKATSSNIHLTKQDAASASPQEMFPEDLHSKVRGASEFQLHSENFGAIVDVQNSLQERHNSREGSSEIVKESLHKDPGPEESTVGSSSQIQAELLQVIMDSQQVHEEYEGSHSLPVDPTVLSLSTSITTTPLTAEAPTSSSSNQHLAEESVDFHGLFKIKERQASILEEAFVKYPHLWKWKLSQRTLRICKVGYKSLADMLAFLKSETPRTMDDSKRKKFEDLCYEL